MTPLTDRQAEVLTFERQTWRHAGSKEQAIRQEFGVGATRYYQELVALLDHPAAIEHSPVLVHRLQRIRDSRRLSRSAGVRELA